MCNLLFSLISYRLQANGMWFLHKDFHSFCEFYWLEAPNPDKDHFISPNSAPLRQKLTANRQNPGPTSHAKSEPRWPRFCQSMTRTLPPPGVTILPRNVPNSAGAGPKISFFTSKLKSPSRSQVVFFVPLA